MPDKTKSQPAGENAALGARPAVLQGEPAKWPSVGGMLPESDTTGRKRVEDALKVSELRYRRLFETAKDGILILDADTGQITDLNPFLEDMLGYSHSELVGRTLWEVGLFKDTAASQEAFRQLRSKEYIRYDNLPLKTKRSELRHVEFVSNVYLVDHTTVIQCNIRDISARKFAEDNLRKGNEDLSALVIELQKRDSEMKLLNRMHDLLQSCTTQEEACRVIALMVGELFPGQSGCLAVLHPGDQHLETVARWGDEGLVESTFALEDCWAMRRGQPHEVIDPRASVQCRHFVQPPQTGYLCVPLTVQGDTLGLLCLISAAARASEHRVIQERLVVAVGEAIKLSLSNLKLREKLREQATRDPLTGLFNRRYLEESLPREVRLAQRRKAPLGVAMLDLDHFKRFNDTFGHDAGDLLLREFGQALSKGLRESDITCRYGGEEFALILPDSPLAATRQRVEQLSAAVKKLEVRHGGQLLGTVTVSAGVAAAPEHGSTARELLRAADDALYAAKQAGRDRVVVYRAKESQAG